MCECQSKNDEHTLNYNKIMCARQMNYLMLHLAPIHHIFHPGTEYTFLRINGCHKAGIPVFRI